MFTIYSADVTGNPGNCSYPHKHIILDEGSLKAAVCHDYVCAEYKNSYRNGDNFIGSDCLPVDCDNDHSENPEDWITPEDVLQAFPGVTFAIHYSRFNNRVKNGKPARPKFHVLFSIDYVTDAAFYSKIICSECGNTFRRRIHSSTYGKYVAWVCNTHLEDTSRCTMLYIRDDDLKLAFITMINKLVYCHKLVLKPYLKTLQENTGDASLLNIQQLEMLLEQNTEQRETLHKLMGQGYIDQILFTQENNALLSQANDYRNEIEALNRSQSLDATKVYETERLLHFCERGEMQLEYSEELFELFVDHIEVYSRQKIGFALHCGLILKEMI